MVEADGGSGDIMPQVAESLRKMAKIINNLMARADCVPFREPVDWKGLQLHDYPKIIKRPMDLGSIKNNLENQDYGDVAECADDVRLVWRNCMTYNADGSDFYRLGEQLSVRFEERCLKLIAEFGEDVICGNTTGREAANGGGGGRKSTSNSRRSLTPPPGAGTKGSKYDTSLVIPLDVRTRFAARLQRLSGMELGHVMQVIDMSCPQALEDPSEDQLRSDAPPQLNRHNYAWDEFNGGCQVEVDIDAIPPETFWTLDKYVKEKVQGRGKGAWAHDVAGSEEQGTSKRRKH